MASMAAHRFVVAALTLTLLSLPAIAQQICPITGLPPTQPAVPLHRCVAAANLSCCTTCQEFGTSIKLASETGAAAFAALSPELNASLPDSLFSGIKLCLLLAGNDACINLLEGFTCAIQCNADAGRFLMVTNNTVGEIVVCNDFVDRVYSTCGTLQIPILQTPLSNYITSAKEFLQSVVVPILIRGSSLSSLNITITPSGEGTDPCFNGPPEGSYPKVSLCCDKLADTPQECIVEADVTDLAATVVNRSISSQICPVITGDAPPFSSPETSPSSTNSAMGLRVSATVYGVLLMIGLICSSRDYR